MIIPLNPITESIREVWRSPVFRREIGILGRSGRKLWRNPLVRLAILCFLMMTALPLLLWWLTNVVGPNRFEVPVFSIGGLLLIAIFVPPFAMNRRVVGLIKTGQLEHLSLTLVRPVVLIRSLLWANFIKFWPLLPAGLIGMVIWTALTEHISRGDLEEILLAMGSSLLAVTLIVMINPLFSLWATLRFYRTRITLLFVIPGSAALSIGIFFVFVFLINWLEGWFEGWIWAPPMATIGLSVWLGWWSLTRAYLDGNFIEELTGGRDVPHRPYGAPPWWRMPVARALWPRGTRLRALRTGAKWMGLGLLAGILIPLGWFAMKWKPWNIAGILSLGFFFIWLVWFGKWMHAVWSKLSPCGAGGNLTSHDAHPDDPSQPPSSDSSTSRIYPMPVMQLLISPPLVLIAITAFGGERMLYYRNRHWLNLFNQGTYEYLVIFWIGLGIHLLYYLFCFAWLGAGQWRAAAGMKRFWRRIIVAVVISEISISWITWKINPIVERIRGTRTYWDLGEVEVWLWVSLVLLPPLAGWMLVRTLQILRNHGVQLAENNDS